MRFQFWLYVPFFRFGPGPHASPLVDLGSVLKDREAGSPPIVGGRGLGKPFGKPVLNLLVGARL